VNEVYKIFDVLEFNTNIIKAGTVDRNKVVLPLIIPMLRGPCIGTKCFENNNLAKSNNIPS